VIEKDQKIFRKKSRCPLTISLQDL